MRELAIAQAIFEKALSHIQAAGTGRVTTLYLVRGEKSGMAEDTIRFYWSEISRGTSVEDTCLNFRREPAELLCLTCDQRYPSGGNGAVCPTCGSEKIKVVAGEEIYLEAIEVELRNLVLS